MIVHQYWDQPGSRGHYRVVTGYDDANSKVDMVDPRTGEITQSYPDFLAKWNVDEPWMAYNSLAFNTSTRKPLDVKLPSR